MYRIFRLATSPIVLIGAMASLVVVLIDNDYDFLAILAAFSEKYPHLYIDELGTALMASVALWILVVVRWALALRREVARREEAERQALVLARHDPLTGLPNRRLFKEEIAAALRLAGGCCAVLFVDLDSFKTVNDAF